jgi:hypothetical protein
MLLELATEPPALPNEELDEQLDCAPPELVDIVASAPLLPLEAAPLASVLGPIVEPLEVAVLLELVEALELLEQLPVLPLTPDFMLRVCVLVELLQLYAIVVFGMDVIRNVVASTTIPLINSNLFIFVTKQRTISVIR